MVPDIDERNARWESELTDMDAVVWESLKELGVRAYWEDPHLGSPSDGPQSGERVKHQSDRSEFYHFTVEYQGTVLCQQIRHVMSMAETEHGSLLTALNRLEGLGINTKLEL